MPGEADPFEHVAFLSRSETRVRLLALLGDEGPMTRRDLRDELDTSQSTVVRSVQALDRRGWVENDDGAVRVTATGEVIVDAFTDLLDAVDDTTDLEAFLRWFPHREFDLDLTQLHGATVTKSSPGDPYAPARTQTELVRTASRFRGFLPSIDLEGTRVVHGRITAGELDAEVIVGPDVEETIRNGAYAPLFREKLETGRLSVLLADAELPFYLGLSGDGVVQIGVENDGIPRALLETDGEPVLSWAEDVYREYRERASERSADDF